MALEIQRMFRTEFFNIRKRMKKDVEDESIKDVTSRDVWDHRLVTTSMHHHHHHRRYVRCIVWRGGGGNLRGLRDLLPASSPDPHLGTPRP